MHRPARGGGRGARPRRAGRQGRGEQAGPPQEGEDHVEAAIATAQAKLPNAKLKAAEIEEENGKLIYSFDFETAGKTGIDEVNIDALTGKQVGKVEHESPASEKKEATADSAKAAKARAKKRVAWRVGRTPQLLKPFPSSVSPSCSLFSSQACAFSS